MTQQPFSFPYPELGTTVRVIDEGCRTCVHKTYCPALYWWKRGLDSRAFREWTITDRNIGRACMSWSANTADMVTTINQRDLDEEEYIWVQGIGSEADRCGITGPVTGPSRR